MIAETAFTLALAMLAATLAVVLIAVLRKPLRYAVGARAAYCIWILVPASALFVLLPVTSQLTYEPTVLLSSPIRSAVSGALFAMNHPSTSTDFVQLVLAVWAGGVVLAMAILLRRHRAFVRSLGTMTVLPDGSVRATGCTDPVLLGILRPRVVLPSDFDTRYDENERAMILTHELTHLGRWDVQINAVAAGWLCLSWFNPLMYWAERLFRLDQELACDAAVLAKPGTTPRRYAEALLKTQVAADVVRRHSGIGCHWRSIHPLKERISMLRRPLPGGLRRNFGFGLTFAVIVLGCYAVKAAQAELPTPQSAAPLVALNVRWLFNRVVVPIMVNLPSDALLRSGGTLDMGFTTPEYGSNEFQCTVTSKNGKDTSTGEGASGKFLISCKLFNKGRIFATPKILTRDGETAAMELTNPTGIVIRLEFNASSSKERVAAASKAVMENVAQGVAGMPVRDGEKRFVLRKVPAQEPPTPPDRSLH